MKVMSINSHKNYLLSCSWGCQVVHSAVVLVMPFTFSFSFSQDTNLLLILILVKILIYFM